MGFLDSKWTTLNGPGQGHTPLVSIPENYHFHFETEVTEAELAAPPPPRAAGHGPDACRKRESACGFLIKCKISFSDFKWSNSNMPEGHTPLDAIYFWGPLWSALFPACKKKEGFVDSKLSKFNAPWSYTPCYYYIWCGCPAAWWEHFEFHTLSSTKDSFRIAAPPYIGSLPSSQLRERTNCGKERVYRRGIRESTNLTKIIKSYFPGFCFTPGTQQPMCSRNALVYRITSCGLLSCIYGTPALCSGNITWMECVWSPFISMLCLFW